MKLINSQMLMYQLNLILLPLNFINNHYIRLLKMNNKMNLLKFHQIIFNLNKIENYVKIFNKDLI